MFKQRMKKTCFSGWLVAGILFCTSLMEAHPGSGIVVDRNGNVYFVDTGSGVWKVSPDGSLGRVPGPAYHWMAMDIDGRLRNASLHFSRGDATVTPVGEHPTLLLASDFPIAVGLNGNLYYPWFDDRLNIQCRTPSGTTSVLAESVKSPGRKPPRWLNGMAVGPDSTIYYTENDAVRKISPWGSISTVVENITVSDCDSLNVTGEYNGVYLRGIDVDARGTIYAAATGCCCVLEISGRGTVRTVLKSQRPWSPTGVAVSGDELYVLEYFHTAGENRREWLPRVRKVSRDGSVRTIAEITHR